MRCGKKEEREEKRRRQTSKETRVLLLLNGLHVFPLPVSQSSSHIRFYSRRACVAVRRVASCCVRAVRVSLYIKPKAPSAGFNQCACDLTHVATNWQNFVKAGSSGPPMEIAVATVVMTPRTVNTKP